MSQADVDHIKAQVDAIAGELFHYDEIKEPVPETGQRKSQMWHLLNLPAGERYEHVRRGSASDRDGAGGPSGP